MNYRLSKEEEEYQEKFRNWLNNNIPTNGLSPIYRPPDNWDERIRLYRDFRRRMFDAGYAGILYPKAYGGRSGTFMEHIIITELLAPWLRVSKDLGTIGFGMAGPTILACGSSEQKIKFIPSLLNGEHIWCQGFSEPNAGSDLTKLSTLAIKDGEDYVINGQKIWITNAHVADYGLLLAVTDPNTEKRHHGMSFFIVDMNLPGITVRPVVQMTGETEFNEVFFDDVRVSRDMMIGEEGQGWQVALTTLGHERLIGDVSFVSEFRWTYDQLVKMAKKTDMGGKKAADDAIIRQKMVKCYIDLMVARLIGYRNVSKVASGQSPGPEGSIGKLFWSELFQRMAALATEIQGPYQQIVEGDLRSIDNGWWQYEYLHSFTHTLAGGTSEIQRNIIAERVLGLPRHSP